MAKDIPILERLYSMKGGPDECREIYGGWADSYEKTMEDDLGYVGPRIVAQALAERAPRDAPVLDAGCGTGLVGAELKRHGFHTIDGIDISEEMLAVAAEKALYRTLAIADLTGTIDLPDASYGGVVSAGVFTNGHVGPRGLDELVRVARPGAPIIVSVHENVWEVDGYPAHLAALSEKGLIHIRDIAEAPYHQKAGYNCRICALEAV